MRALDCKFHLRFVFTPIVKWLAANLGEYSGVTAEKRDVPIVVSLTSYPERYRDLEKSLYSLINQSLKPDRIILWLSDELEILDLPYEITRFVKNGLEIRFVKDIKSYTKVIYTLKEFPSAIVVTADDDIFYPKDWLTKLYHSYISHPNDIHVHRAHRVKLENGEIVPYEYWQKHIDEESARYDNFLTGVGGVLYPPHCFSNEVFRKDIFLKQAPYADDIWLWVMALTHARKIRVVKNHIRTLACTDFFAQILKNRRSLYRFNSKGQNDKQLANLMKYYRRNVMKNICNIK